MFVWSFLTASVLPAWGTYRWPSRTAHISAPPFCVSHFPLKSDL